MKNSCGSPRSSAEATFNCFPLSFRMYSSRLLTILAIVLPIFSIGAAHGFENADCLSCHGEQGIKTMPAGDRLAMVKPLKPGERRLETQAYVERLYLNPEAYQQSAHGTKRCDECHSDITTLPHQLDLKVDCRQCHGEIVEQFEQSSHRRFMSLGESLASACEHCHSNIHYTLVKENGKSPVYPANLIRTCAKCHSDMQKAKEVVPDKTMSLQSYLSCVHGQGLIRHGLIVAAVCNDCHGSHNIQPASDERSMVNRKNLVATCGTCHQGIAVVYEKSIHGQLLAQGNPDVPMCTSCHTNHPIAPVETEGFKLGIVKECGGCHEEHDESFERSYHGKVTSLGGTATARCSDCHHYHDILPKSDPHSSIASGNLITTCQRCHPKANKNFAEYVPHIDYRDRTNYPVVFYTWLFMTVLLVGTLVFFTIHSILWFIRSLFDKDLRHQVATSQGRHIMRFRLFHRMTHGLIIVSFLGLAATGFPLKYSYTNWAQKLMAFLGGYQVAGTLHRFFAILTLVYVVMHVGYIVYYIRVKRRQPLLKFLFGHESMVLRLKDIKDFWMHVKWFFWLGPKPRWDRWTYWEKFDYWGEFWGVTVIGLSGLMLWFPTMFSIFLPGWMFNVATVVHSIEALLAAGVIFTVHFFNAHFRPGKFPMDPVIFTGRITEEEFAEERPEEYQRLVDEGRVEENLTDVAPRWLGILARVVGFTALLIGLFLIVAALATEFRNIFG